MFFQNRVIRPGAWLDGIDQRGAAQIEALQGVGPRLLAYIPPDRAAFAVQSGTNPTNWTAELTTPLECAHRKPDELV